MAWLLLVAAAMTEIAWGALLKLGGDFSKFWPSVAAYLIATVSFFLLAAATRSLPVGTAYAVWGGLGTVGITVMGIVAFGESASPLRLALLGLIVIGTIGLKLVHG